VYFIAENKITKLESIVLKDGFNILNIIDAFSYLQVSTNQATTEVSYSNENTKDIAYHMVSRLSDNNYYPITRFNAKEALTGTIKLSVALRVNAGRVKLKGGDYYNSSVWAGPLLGIGQEVYETGTYKIESNLMDVRDLS